MKDAPARERLYWEKEMSVIGKDERAGVSFFFFF